MSLVAYGGSSDEEDENEEQEDGGGKVEILTTANTSQNGKTI